MTPDPRGGMPHAHIEDAHPSADRRAPLVPEHHGSGKGLDLTVEFLTAIGLYGILGWLVDGWLGTAHWGMGIGVMFGYACGIYLLWVHGRDAGAKTGNQQASRTTADAGPREGARGAIG